MLSYAILILVQNAESLDCFTYTCESSDESSCVLREENTNYSLILNYRCGQLCDRPTVEDYFRQNLSASSYDDCDLSSSNSKYNLTVNEKVSCPHRNNLTVDYNLTYETYFDYYKNASIINCTYDQHSDLIYINQLAPENPEDKITLYEEDPICGLDGVAYCKPSISSKVFADFWEICDENDEEIDLKSMKLWEYYRDWFVEVTTGPYCAEDVYFNVSIPNLDYIVELFADRVGVGAFIIFFNYL